MMAADSTEVADPNTRCRLETTSGPQPTEPGRRTGASISKRHPDVVAHINPDGIRWAE